MKKKLFIGIIFLIILSTFCACSNKIIKIIPVYDKVYTPGNTYKINLEDENKKAIESIQELSFEIMEGKENISLDEKNLSFTINENAKVNSFVTIKISSKYIQTFNYRFLISTIKPSFLRIDNEIDKVVGEKFNLNIYKEPTNANIDNLEIIIEEGKDFIDIDGKSITIKKDAPVNEKVSIRVKSGNIQSEKFSFMITPAKLEVVDININDKSELYQGETVEINFVKYPKSAKMTDYKFIVDKGSEYVSFVGDFIVIDENAPVNTSVSFKLQSGDIISNSIEFNIIKFKITSIDLTAEDDYVAIGNEIKIESDVHPYLPSNYNLKFKILEENIQAKINDAGILHILPDAASGSAINIYAYVTDQNNNIIDVPISYLSLNIYKVDVTQVILSTSDDYQDLKYNDVVNFNVKILPENATNKDVHYTIVEGYSYAYLESSTGKLTISKNENDSVVRIKATVDNVASNIFEVTVKKDFDEVVSNSWENISQNFNSINMKFDLSNMPTDADLTTVVVPHNVKRLHLIGNNSDSIKSCINNLFFYFNKCQDEFELTLENVGIEINKHSNRNVFDFPQGSNVTIKLIGDNYIKAGTPVNPYNYAVDGVFDKSLEYYWYRKNGMDGLNGADGGDCISGDYLNFVGVGNLIAVGGDGASGTNGGNGASVPDNETLDTFSGNGGYGGCGGNSGYAIFGRLIRMDIKSGMIHATSGKAGKGGQGGFHGENIPVNGHLGSDGLNGVNGECFKGLHSVEDLQYITGKLSNYEGGLIENSYTEPDFETVDELNTRITNTYGVILKLRNNINFLSDYSMTFLNDDEEIIYMLSILDNVLSKYPSNYFREIQLNSSKQIEISICNTINKTSINIGGLASPSTYNVWFANCKAKMRDSFYSNLENIAFHELTHITQYNLKAVNYEINYNRIFILSGKYPYDHKESDVAVYNPHANVDVNKAYFLSSYSRKSESEDICETFSMHTRQGHFIDFMGNDKNIRRKLDYIFKQIDDGMETCASYKTETWQRFLQAS